MKKFDVDIPIDLDAVRLWQYNNATRLNQLIDNEQLFANTNISNYWKGWQSEHFNLTTANGTGLDLWGTILSLPRPADYPDDMYRKLLQARIMLFNSNGSIYDINKFLKWIFSDARIFVIDRQDMTIRIYLMFALSDDEMQVLTNGNFLPRPAGVLLQFYVLSNIPLGFNTAEASTMWETFDNGTFWR